jgi:hypothetical protein
VAETARAACHERAAAGELEELEDMWHGVYWLPLMHPRIGGFRLPEALLRAVSFS